MSLPFVILLDLLLIYFFFGSNLVEWFTPPSQRPRRQLKEQTKNLKALLHRNRDLFNDKQLNTATAMLGECTTRLADKKPIPQAEFQGLSEKIAKTIEALPLPRALPSLRNSFEVIVVAFGVAFSLRSLLIGPFGIPTGSMQPTLYGIHYIQRDEPQEFSLPRRVFDYLNYSQRHLRFVAPADGKLDYLHLQPARSLPLLPNTQLTFQSEQGAAQAWLFPATQIDTQKTIQEEYHDIFLSAAREPWLGAPQLSFQKGDVVFNGVMEQGDHLFVNRLSLAFHDPSRGQVMVFDTKGILYNGTPLSGQYYIKRIVGMPGDTLKIMDRALWVRPAGKNDFHKLDGDDAPGFAKINSQTGGYRGYAVMPSAQYLRYEGEEYTVPSECYFMMGDNTENSLDSRFWGAVPRENLVGSPCFVWWPFSERFGFFRD
ncbi:MAG: signal peptidase I [Victivallales bacterium]|nr:signal peptidase I [Victivallales bacterium]